MKVLEVLTYYRPHISGLTIYVERLSAALAAEGHEVVVLTSQYDESLPRQETIQGVRVERVPVAFRVSKGVIMPTFGLEATRWTRWADVIHLHLPQFDAPGLALRGRLLGKPVVLTYHCDLQLPPGLLNRVANNVILLMNNIAGALADAVVTYTRDYGTHSPFLSRYLGQKLHIIPPPVELDVCPPTVARAFAARHELAGKKVIGISARIAAEKGLEVLLRALPHVLEAHPDALVLHASPETLGEEAYAARLAPLIAQSGDHYQQLGALRGAELTAFYKSLDVLVIPSLNSTESFGLVQVEAMMNGAPVVSSNLPGVRQPVTMTGMGEVAAIGDHEALAEALIRVLDKKERYLRPPDVIAESFSPRQTAQEYLRLFEALREGSEDRTAAEPEAYERLRRLREAEAPAAEAPATEASATEVSAGEASSTAR
ncbi:MAG: glycosyltransferase family 4 protein [Candidatus Promineifilaceae bacterium]|nr:glycosyltransferase family 4 protein [Candidatus Promineifilaceae bacterium]